MSLEENDINTNENTEIKESNDIMTTITDNNLDGDVIEKKSIDSNEEEDELSSISQEIFKRSHSAPINTKNLPEIEFEILDNSFLDNKEIKSLYNLDENLIKKLLGNKRNPEESEPIINKSEEKKEPELSLTEKIKFYDTPYDKLTCISKEIGLQIVIDYIINIINNNNKNTIYLSCCDNKEVEEIIKNILREVTEETLYIYLMKILAAEQKQNIEVLTEYKLSLDSKLRSRASIQLVNKVVKKRVVKKKQFDLEMAKNTNYRSNHFYNVGGQIYCYIPKHFIRSQICFLYCAKETCKAKLYLDMKRKKGRIYGKHSHGGIDLTQYEEEFPEIKDEDDWEHIQYDMKDNKKFFVWKT